MALVCFKPPTAVCQFDLMGDSSNTVDKIYLHDISAKSTSDKKSFDMKHNEEHMKRLFEEFPNDHVALNEFIKISNRSMIFVKLFMFARLLPRFLQDLFWAFVPSSVIESAARTAEEILPTLTTNKKLISLLSSMWIDTGARPDVASFMLTASVFRGISMEGGSYPRDGAEALALELADVINENNGNILVRAAVGEIIIENGICCGVRMKDGVVIRSKRVVSSAGYANTYQNLVSSSHLKQYNIPPQLPVEQSAGFVMVNIGMYY
jgi:phytoene dehydrogenase-like protein